MKVLWIDDQPESKIHQFDKVLHKRGKDLSLCKSDNEKLDLLKSVGIDIIVNLQAITNIYQNDNWAQEIFEFFNKYDLIFLDVNLTDSHGKGAYFPKEEYLKLKEKTGVDFKPTYEGEALFLTALKVMGYKDSFKFTSKFYFFSAYQDLLSDVKRELEIIFGGECKEWTDGHCFTDQAGDRKDDFKPYNFTNEKYDRFFRSLDEPWVKKDKSNSWTINIKSETFTDIVAARNHQGKWTISFVYDNDKILLSEGTDFKVSETYLKPSSDLILEAFESIQLSKIEALFHKYYQIGLLKKSKVKLDHVFFNYYNLCSDNEYELSDLQLKGLFTELRELFEITRDGIQEMIFPDNSFEKCMMEKEYKFWNQTAGIIESKKEQPYPAKKIEKMKSSIKNLSDWEPWMDFHAIWMSCRRARTSLDRLLLACPKYIHDTIKWAYNNMLSAYELHPAQPEYEISKLANEILPSKKHEYKALVDALFLILDFIIIINENDELIRRSQQYVPFYMAHPENREKNKERLSVWEELMIAIRESSHTLEEIFNYIRS